MRFYLFLFFCLIQFSFGERIHIGEILTPISSISLKSPEIVSYMEKEKILFVVGGENVLQMVDLSDVKHPKVLRDIELKGLGTSVSVYKDLVAVSMSEKEEHQLGHVSIFKYGEDLQLDKNFENFCHLPDMVTFSPDGKKILIACEGSPSLDFKEDPEGGIGIISVENKGDNKYSYNSLVLNFDTVDTVDLKNKGIRAPGIFGFIKSLEPEYITISKDSKYAWVSLQENNALAFLDLTENKIKEIFPLGFVDHSKEGFGLDIFKNNKIEIENYPIYGLRQPDGISNFYHQGKNYVFTANEGASVNDSKIWTDETTVGQLFKENRLDDSIFTPDILEKMKDYVVSNIDYCSQDTTKENDRKCPFVYGFGSRSISVFDGRSGALLWDSGEMFERAFEKYMPKYFNYNSKKNKVKMDSRSNKKGSEPENITIGEVENKIYVFIGFERMGALAVLDFTSIKEEQFSPKLVDLYFDSKNRGPEGILFIPKEKSPTGENLLIVAFEYSKTLSIYSVR